MEKHEKKVKEIFFQNSLKTTENPDLMLLNKVELVFQDMEYISGIIFMMSKEIKNEK